MYKLGGGGIIDTQFMSHTTGYCITIIVGLITMYFASKNEY